MVGKNRQRKDVSKSNDFDNRWEETSEASSDSDKDSGESLVEVIPASTPPPQVLFATPMMTASAYLSPPTGVIASILVFREQRPPVVMRLPSGTKEGRTEIVPLEEVGESVPTGKV